MTRELASIALRLNREARAGALPALYFVTDPARTPDPVGVAQRLPRGMAIIYRHFGADDRFEVATRLAAVARKRGLKLLIGADPVLARQVRAAGIHLPERMSHRAAALRQRRWLVTAAAHGRRGLAKACGADAALLSPIFASGSASAGSALTPERAGRLARSVALPVIALGGVNARTAKRLLGRGFAGIAAVEALAR